MATSTISPSPSLLSPPDHTIRERIKDNPATGSLKFCTNIQEIKQIHGQMTRTGLTQIPSAVSKLIAAYTKVATLESMGYAKKAFELFGEEEEPKLFMWNSLIRGFSAAGYGKEAVSLYIDMVNRGVVSDRFTFPPLFATCTKISAFEEGAQLHGSLMKMESEGGDMRDDSFIQNSLIHFYCECGEMDSAQLVFDGMCDRNVVSWTSLIDGYARRDNPQKAVSLFDDMKGENKIRPNSVTMACVVSACTKLQDLHLGERICGYISASGIGLTPVLANSLVDMYMKCGAVEAAERLFEECTDRNIVLWNTMVSNYARRGLANQALIIFNEMLVSGLRPDRVTIVAAVSASGQLGELMIGRRFHCYILRNGLDGWDTVSNSVIDMYMKCGESNAAYIVFEQMPNKNVISWNTVIGGCIRNGDLASAWRHFEMMPGRDLVSWNTIIAASVQDSCFEEAIELFRAMQDSGLRPDRVTMISVASACGHLGALDLAKWIYTHIIYSKIPCDVRLGTALIDMFARCGDPKSSMQVFNEMQTKDVLAWTAAIGAMAVEGNGKRAIELFAEMVEQGMEPDGVVFVGVLTACSHSGLVEEGRCFFRSMSEDYGIAPQLVHYGCMVDLLGRAGLLREARMLIERMPMEPNDVIWGALLAACRIHHDLELAEYAAKQVIALAPERSGIHVLLSNVYASAGRWQDVAKVRLCLKDMGVQKHPGSSLIQVNGTIHEFTSSNESHPQMDQIDKMLSEIDRKLRFAGHVPDLANVLLDVDEEEKEFLLSRHSEKIAVAFGLISIGHGVPVRVIKNLRICVDCHSLMKLVSTIYDREIAIRDNNRYHFFRRGVCSCRDYW